MPKSKPPKGSSAKRRRSPKPVSSTSGDREKTDIWAHDGNIEDLRVEYLKRQQWLGGFAPFQFYLIDTAAVHDACSVPGFPVEAAINVLFLLSEAFRNSIVNGPHALGTRIDDHVVFTDAIARQFAESVLRLPSADREKCCRFFGRCREAHVCDGNDRYCIDSIVAYSQVRGYRGVKRLHDGPYDLQSASPFTQLQLAVFHSSGQHGAVRFDDRAADEWQLTTGEAFMPCWPLCFSVQCQRPADEMPVLFNGKGEPDVAVERWRDALLFRVARCAYPVVEAYLDAAWRKKRPNDTGPNPVEQWLTDPNPKTMTAAEFFVGSLSSAALNTFTERVRARIGGSFFAGHTAVSSSQRDLDHENLAPSLVNQDSGPCTLQSNPLPCTAEPCTTPPIPSQTRIELTPAERELYDTLSGCAMTDGELMRELDKN